MSLFIFYITVAGSDAGSVRVYQYSSSTWTKLGADIDGEAVDDKSGGSVSINSAGNIVAVGAIGNDGTAGTYKLWKLNYDYLNMYNL